MEHVFQKLSGDNKVEDEELKIWKKFEDEENPDVFQHLSLAHDGGFSEVKELYTPTRWISAAILVIFVVYNVYSVIVLDISFITDAEGAVIQMGGQVSRIMKPFYLSKGITSLMFTDISPVSLLGMLELMGVMYYLANGVLCIYQSRTDTGFKKWYAVQLAFWETLPVLSTYSGIKLLYHVVPGVLTANVSQKIARIIEDSQEGRGIKRGIREFVWYLFGLSFCFVVGFDIFLMKLRVVAAKATAQGMSLAVVLPCIQFLIQVLGVVQLGPFVKERLFTFIFGGEDGVLQDEEVELMETWLALLARRMYREFTFPQFLAVMLSFSDVDFQKLVLNENAKEG